MSQPSGADEALPGPGVPQLAGDRQLAVEAFHRALRLTVAPAGSAPALRDVPLRMHLLTEEADEVVAALHEGDLAALGGELSDLLYVTYGAAVTFGLALADGESRPLAGRPAIRQAQNLAERVSTTVATVVASMGSGDLPAASRGLASMPPLVEEVAATCGLRVGPFFDAVQIANMAKVGGPVRDDGKRLKPDGWQPADLQAVLEAQQAAG